MEEKTPKSLAKLGGVWALGISMPMSIAMGLGGGYWLDRWLETSPVLTLGGLFLGIVSAFLNLYRETKRVE